MHAATVDEWVQTWRAKAFRTDPLTSDEWRQVREAIDDSYVLAGATRPSAVIRARSPREVMAMALAHQEDQSMAQVNASARISEAIREHELSLLQPVRITGEIASRVDGGVLSPNVWGNQLHPHMLRSPCSGNLRPGLAAEVTWILEHASVPLTATIMRGLRSIVGRSLAGPARLLDDLAFVSDMPTQILYDEDGTLHCDAGPAIVWSDRTGLNFWHGTRVPNDFFRWSVDRALTEVNVEVRRCAIERLGVDGLERTLTLLAEAPDPANPPHMLRLYDLPRPWLSGRLLVVENASVDKGGRRRRFQIFVPPHITDPVEAVANSFGMIAAEYTQLQRAT